MGWFNAIFKFIVKKFWPWFKDFVWPYLKDHVNELISFILDRFKNQIKDIFSDRTERRRKEAQEKADAAEKRAKGTSDDGESERLRATAQVWREVAEQFRRDNEEMKAKLDEMEAETKATSEGIVQDMEFDVDFSETTPVLKLGENRHELPALPG
ncbi:hypothetical protein GF354_04890 [Candidatus Peregrinibacteria bacterium]|nr:hypothetical protein [Candidatus Peregrinibacteria bacterium]